MSLVGELVPEAAPAELPWQPIPAAEERQLALACQLPAALPGLMPRLIVRTHRYTTGRHWLRGVHLEHQRQEAAALLELRSPSELHLTARSANSPLNLFEVAARSHRRGAGQPLPGRRSLATTCRAPAATAAGPVQGCSR